MRGQISLQMASVLVSVLFEITNDPVSRAFDKLLGRREGKLTAF